MNLWQKLFKGKNQKENTSASRAKASPAQCQSAKMSTSAKNISGAKASKAARVQQQSNAAPKSAHSKGFLQSAKVMLGLVVILCLSFVLSACDTSSVTDIFNRDSSIYDSLGRLMLTPSTVTFVETEREQTSGSTTGDYQDVNTTNSRTGSFIISYNPYEHSLTDKSSVVYRFPDLSFVVDGETIYYFASESLQNLSLYSGNTYSFTAHPEVFARYSSRLSGGLVYSNQSLGANATNKVNEYYPLSLTGQFLKYNNQTGKLEEVSSSEICIEYRLTVIDTATGSEAIFDESTQSYLVTPGAAYNSISYSIRYNPALKNGGTRRSLKVKLLVGEGSVLYGNSAFSNACVFDVSKLTFSVNSANSAELGYGELIIGDEYYFYDKTTTFSAENQTYYLTSVTGFFPYGRQVKVSRSFPGSKIGTAGNEDASSDYALASWTVNTYSNEVTASPIMMDGLPITTASLSESELNILRSSISTDLATVGNQSDIDKLFALSQNNLSSKRSNVDYVRNSSVYNLSTDGIKRANGVEENARTYVGSYLSNSTKVDKRADSQNLYFEKTPPQPHQHPNSHFVQRKPRQQFCGQLHQSYQLFGIRFGI